MIERTAASVYYEEIICLAKARRHGAYCVAGKCIRRQSPDFMKWIRPIAPDGEGEISQSLLIFRVNDLPPGRRVRMNDAIQQGNGAAVCSLGHGLFEAGLLDRLTIPLLGPSPHLYQRENYLAAGHDEWRCGDQLAPIYLSHFLDDPESLWENGLNSKNCLNNKVRMSYLETCTQSLLLIRAEELHFCLAEDARSRMRGLGRFSYHGVDYRLPITDSAFERQYVEGFAPLKAGENLYPGGACYLCISLALFQDHGYKLIAGIMPAGDTR